MSGDTNDIGVLSVGEQVSAEMNRKKEQELKDKASDYLTVLNFLNNRHNDSFISQVKKNIQINDQVAIDELFLQNEQQITKIFGLFNFLRSNEESIARCQHDLGAIANGVEGNLSLILDYVHEGDEINFELLKNLLYVWDRYFVVVEDMLLRMVSKEKISSEFQTGTDVDALKGVDDYFNTRELESIRVFSTKAGSAYKKINGIQINLVSNEVWGNLNMELKDKKIGGNSGLVGNFVLNALRNALKDRVEATTVTQAVEIKGDWLVIRIVDNGKGIRPKFLQKGYKEIDEITGKEKEIYIFHEGASGTGSTGKGLADFDTRLASVGGELYVSTKTVSDGMIRFQYGSTIEKANEVEFDESLEHGTVFEIRLPIIQKQE